MAKCAGNETAICFVFPDFKNNFAHGIMPTRYNAIGKAIWSPYNVI